MMGGTENVRKNLLGVKLNYTVKYFLTIVSRNASDSFVNQHNRVDSVIDINVYNNY